MTQLFTEKVREILKPVKHLIDGPKLDKFLNELEEMELSYLARLYSDD